MSFKFVRGFLKRQNFVLYNDAKLLILRNIKRYSSFKLKQSRINSWKNFGIISGTAAGVGVYLLCCNGQVLGKDFEFGLEASEINSSQNEYGSVIAKSRELLWRLKDEVGAPGLVVGVSIDGTTIWEEGFGYSDVENRVQCTPDTVMRIASISKSITMAAIAKLWEKGKLDLDKPVHHYVPEFPQKTFNGIPVDITCRHLVSHLGGIRHYDKKSLLAHSKRDSKATSEDQQLSSASSTKKSDSENGKPIKEFEQKEYYIKEKYSDVRSALDLFKDDPLVSKPGTKFHYSTHGWTLASAVVENASGESFTAHMKKLFNKLGMKHTYLDMNDSLIYHRSRNYSKDKCGFIINSPYVDNSYKWAGGGFLSTVGDLLKFANSMLYSLQYESSKNGHEAASKNSEVRKLTYPTLDRNISERNKSSNSRNHPGYLSSETVKVMWTPVTSMKDKDFMYAMGWTVLPEKKECEYCDVQRFYASHTGGAIGASSVLLILPRQCNMDSSLECQWMAPPKGVVVAIMTNLQEIPLNKVAFDIAIMFDSYFPSHT